MEDKSLNERFLAMLETLQEKMAEDEFYVLTKEEKKILSTAFNNKDEIAESTQNYFKDACGYQYEDGFRYCVHDFLDTNKILEDWIFSKEKGSTIKIKDLDIQQKKTVLRIIRSHEECGVGLQEMSLDWCVGLINNLISNTE